MVLPANNSILTMLASKNIIHSLPLPKILIPELRKLVEISHEKESEMEF